VWVNLSLSSNKEMEFSFKLLYFYTIRFNSIVVAELVLNYIQGGSRCGMAKMRGKAGMG
jgi:hypothetical protein